MRPLSFTTVTVMQVIAGGARHGLQCERAVPTDGVGQALPGPRPHVSQACRRQLQVIQDKRLIA